MVTNADGSVSITTVTEVIGVSGQPDRLVNC
jgi:hypothetical protein